MADKICFLVVIIVSYLIGSMNASVVISKILGDDIRNHGSGNAGATNMLRTYGKKMAALALVIDMLKGVIAASLALLVKFLLNLMTIIIAMRAYSPISVMTIYFH